MKASDLHTLGYCTKTLANPLVKSLCLFFLNLTSFLPTSVGSNLP